MSIKTKLALGMTTIAVGATAAIGGTFAYFSDQTTSTNKFTNGTIKIAPSSPYIEQVELTHFKPGDKLSALVTNQDPSITLNNQGTLPFNVFMKVNASSQNPDSSASDMEKLIKVNVLAFGGSDILGSIDANADGDNSYVSLYDLHQATQGDATINNNTISGVGKNIGQLAQSGAAGAIKTVTYELEFVDTGAPQNQYQGDITDFSIEFNALQLDGTTYDKDNLNDTTPGSGGGTFNNTGVY